MALTKEDKEWFELKLAAAMAAAVTAHAETCEMKNEFFGNGKPGAKMDIHDLKAKVAHLEKTRGQTLGFVKAISTSVISSVLTAAILVAVGVKVLPKLPPALPETGQTDVDHGSGTR